MIKINSPTFKQDIKYELAKLGITQKEMGADIGLKESYVSSILSFIRWPKTETYREEIIHYVEKKKGKDKSRYILNGK